MGNLISHLENHLGKIGSGWDRDADNKQMPFQIVKFTEGPIRDTTIYSTLGLSNYELGGGQNGKFILHELLIMLPADCGDRNIPPVIQQIGEEALQKGTAYLHGEVIGPRGPIMKGSEMESFYVTPPVYLPNSFFVCHTDGGLSIVMAWLVPISIRETLYIEKNGWEAFEDRLVEYNPDIVDIFRPSLPL